MANRRPPSKIFSRYHGPYAHVRRRLRRLVFGLQTLTGLAPSGYFIPYRYARTAPQRLEYPAVRTLFEANQLAMEHAISNIAAAQANLAGISREATPPEPRWNQDWFCGLDAAALFSFISDAPPGRMIEIGSGHSTRFAAAALKQHGTEPSIITAIDPAPRADIESLGITVLKKTVQEVDPAVFSSLSGGDILSIDSSHISMPGTDLDWLVGHVLPHLPAGIRLHIHDVFLPLPYPEEWTWRGYNEQTMVAALLAGGGYRPFFASQWLRAEKASLLQRLLGDDFPHAIIAGPEGSHESSLWLVKE
ncbi:MAG: class I SAM-dependent methyltransferase [Pseudomonadota bacterium]